ncbi:MAG: xanthine dehydrogenase family protein molybdopterin-binding subunit, partial [Chloroflexota bacterium]|nr:xanthine dehydrogenase family protein molybdopterin-binding subunit [Chloroflexota bacterium]
MAAPPVERTNSVLGKSIVRVDGRDKVTGQTRYSGDLRLPDMLHAKLALSQHARARIVSIDTSAARQVPGVVDVVTGPDILAMAPGARDNMLLATDKVVYYG